MSDTWWIQNVRQHVVSDSLPTKKFLNLTHAHVPQFSISATQSLRFKNGVKHLDVHKYVQYSETTGLHTSRLCADAFNSVNMLFLPGRKLLREAIFRMLFILMKRTDLKKPRKAPAATPSAGTSAELLLSEAALISPNSRPHCRMAVCRI